MSKRELNRMKMMNNSLKMFQMAMIIVVAMSFSSCTQSTVENASESSKIDVQTQGVLERQVQTQAAFQAQAYTEIEVEGGDLSGDRQPLAKVDVGFGSRDYWAYTNAYGQLIRVEAAEIRLQNETIEPVTENGRYYSDEAKVPGTEASDLDEGHVIADALGGVSNAYNITPQNSQLNRNGDQALMEKSIRDAILEGGFCCDFIAEISYPDTQTQIPSHYSYFYNLNGLVVHDEFDNVDPESINLGLNQDNGIESALGQTYDSQLTSNVSLEITRLDLVAEEVDIQNRGQMQVNLKNYVLVSVKGNQQFVFPAVLLAPGASITVYSKGGEGDLLWTNQYIWNNTGDSAQLLDPQGNILDTH